MPPLIVDEDILFWAFRYAIGRRTYAANDVQASLRANWLNLSKRTRAVITVEIHEWLEQCRDTNNSDITNGWRSLIAVPQPDPPP